MYRGQDSGLDGVVGVADEGAVREDGKRRGERRRRRRRWAGGTGGRCSSGNPHRLADQSGRAWPQGERGAAEGDADEASRRGRGLGERKREKQRVRCGNSTVGRSSWAPKEDAAGEKKNCTVNGGGKLFRAYEILPDANGKKHGVCSFFFGFVCLRTVELPATVYFFMLLLLWLLFFFQMLHAL